MNAREIISFNYLLENTMLQIDGLKLELVKTEQEVAHQLRVVIAISKEIASLEKLKEKQKEAYSKQELKETELQNLEHITISLGKKQNVR